MDFQLMCDAIASDSGVCLPSLANLRATRELYLHEQLSDPNAKIDIPALHALEYFSKCQGLPAIVQSSSRSQFFSCQACPPRVSASDEILTSMADALHWLWGEFSFEGAATHCAHGPGATLEGLKSLDKWLFKLPSCKLTDFIDPLNRFPRDPGVRLSRFSEVPKTSWSTRGICIEETGGQFLQQGIGRYMRTRLRYFGIDISKAWSRNIQMMANRENLTLDLSAASDSITRQLMILLCDRPSLIKWFDVMDSTRSMWCSDPVDHEIVSLSSFASMGNGFCFTLLTSICAAACITAMRMTGVHIDSRQSAMRNFHEYSSVFGDDIVIAERFAPALRLCLAMIGLKVNDLKSSTLGPMRESCGAYALHSDSDVSIVSHIPRLKFFLQGRGSLSQWVSVCQTQRHLCERGWWSSAKCLLDTALDSPYAPYMTILPWVETLTSPSQDKFASTLTMFSTDAFRTQSWKRSRPRQTAWVSVYAPIEKVRAVSVGDIVGYGACLLGSGLPDRENCGENTTRLQRRRVYR